MGQVTIREIIASICILAIMLIIGFFISEKLNDTHQDTVAQYYKALKIKEPEVFSYAMSTNIGDALVEGELVAVNPVTYEEIGGQYTEVQKIKEEYVRKTRTVTTTNSKGKTVTKTEVYYEWEQVHRESKQVDEVTFLGVTFPSTKFNLPSTSYIDTINKGFDVRYVYYGSPEVNKLTALMYLEYNDIRNIITNHYNNTIEQVMDKIDVNTLTPMFWVGWLCLTAYLIYAFCYAENSWLNL